MNQRKGLENQIQREVLAAIGAICNNPNLKALDFNFPAIFDNIEAINTAHAALEQVQASYKRYIQLSVRKLERQGARAIKAGDLHTARRIINEIHAYSPRSKRPIERLEDLIMKKQAAQSEALTVNLDGQISVYPDGKVPSDMVGQLFPADCDRAVSDFLFDAGTAETCGDYPGALDALMQAELLDPCNTAVRTALARVRLVMGNSVFGEPSALVA